MEIDRIHNRRKFTINNYNKSLNVLQFKHKSYTIQECIRARGDIHKYQKKKIRKCSNAS